MYGLKTESSFDAAHFLTDYHGKCENLHGHRWRVVAYLEQEELQTQGTHKDMVIDFADFKGALRDLTEAFDHSFVVEEGSLAPNTLACLEREGFSLSVVPFRTTAENFARYFYGKLADAGFPCRRSTCTKPPTTARSTVASDRDNVGSQTQAAGEVNAGSQTAGAPGRDAAHGSAAPASLEASADCPLPVAERFVSVNGEGRAAGKLAAFIRFTGCNLACSYCDTMWANAPAAADRAERVSVADLVAWARETRVEWHHPHGRRARAAA